MPDLDDLRLLLDTADQQNLGAVARTRHVSQSTVSRAVQRVELALGQPVFDRVGKSVRLRPDSATVIDEVRVIVDRWTLLVARPASTRVPLSLFCTVTASQAVVPALLASFRRSHPDVELSLRTGPASDAVKAVLDGTVDVAVAALPARLPAALVAQQLTSSPLIAVAASDVRGWAGAQLILPRTGVTRDLVDVWRRKALPADIAVQETDSHEEVIALAALGSGIGIVPRLVVETSALRPQLRELTPPARLPVMLLGLVARRRDLHRPPVAELWTMVR